MIELVSQVTLSHPQKGLSQMGDPQTAQPQNDNARLSERLDDFAREMEGAGLPWAAERIRSLSGLIAAEHGLAQAFRV